MPVCACLQCLLLANVIDAIDVCQNTFTYQIGRSFALSSVKYDTA